MPEQINSGNPQLDNKIQEWIQWDQNEKTKAEICKLLEDGKYESLSKVLLDRLAFGTAGLRGKMAAGYAAMNDLVIIQTGQGLLKHLEECESKLLKENGIVIGYDGRYNSRRFSELTASIFLHKGYKVRLFSTVVPTPFVPFSVSRYKCAIGVMVTASHNPKEDNGYKVYGSNGAQIISPADKNIQQHIMENLEPLETSWNTSIVNKSENLSDPLDDIMKSYMDIVERSLVPSHVDINKKSNMQFIYSAMHGVGYNYVKEAFKRAHLTVIPVEEQKDPDPEFPTVKFPNPEEGKSSLDLSIRTAEKFGCKVILANDPDADRLACAEKDESTGEWRVFNGNELGALLGWWMLHCHQTVNPNSTSKPYMLSSTVSSKILRSIAEKEDLNFVETLTGFKWMGNHSYDLMQDSKQVLFAFEEAIGFMCGTAVLDKDGVSAAVHLATLAAYLNYRQLSLSQQLDEIYQYYGYHVSLNSYFICHDSAKIKKIFDRLRNFNGPNTYPKSIMQNRYQIKHVRDLTTGFDDSQPDKKATLPTSKSSQMITFTFTNGLVATLRTSGTEPKVKYYTELCASPLQPDKTEIEAVLDEMVQGIVKEFLQPNENGLIAKSE